jgi:hypothetical protein
VHERKSCELLKRKLAKRTFLIAICYRQKAIFDQCVFATQNELTKAKFDLGMNNIIPTSLVLFEVSSILSSHPLLFESFPVEAISDLRNHRTKNESR